MTKFVYPHLSDWSTEPSDQHHSNGTEHNRFQFQDRSKRDHSLRCSFLQGLLLSLLTGILIFGAVLPLYLSSKMTNNPNNVTTSTPVQYIYWSFDQNANDLYNNYNGMTVNNPTYVTGYTALNSSALNLIGSSSQYMTVISPFLNLTWKSFTIEMWFYPTVLTSADYGLFGQCQSVTMDHCLVYLIRNFQVYLGFYGDDRVGTTSLTAGQWYHVAFVYDYSISTQFLYLNGFLEGSRLSYPYQGMNGTITIGAIYFSPSTNFFSGYIDRVSLVTQAKNASQILDDASLVCYYSFDSNSYFDSGPLGLNGSGVGLSAAIGLGRVNDAILLNSSGSYFVSGGMTMLGVVGQSYSMSVWVQPTSVNGGTIIYVSECNYNCANWCLAMMGFTSSGQIVNQSWRNVGASPMVALTGPILPTNVWTHIVHTYSSTNGIRLYLNGTLFSQSSPFTYSASGAPNYLYLGDFPLIQCVASGNVISMGQYYGLIDEFRLFSREITAAEVSALANP